MSRSAASQPVQMPGAPTADTDTAADTAAEQPAGASPTVALDAKDARIAALEAQIAALAPADPAVALIVEGNGPHNLQAIATSKHRHLTSTELDRRVRAGECALSERHVLCSDGWYVNPFFVAS